MGCHGNWSETSCRLPTGLLPGREAFVGRIIDSERLSEAEEWVAELIARIQPNEASEKRRKDIADYMQILIGKCFSCQVFIFGSLPLMTYLPDGDIDLTVFSDDEHLKEIWAEKVYQVMKEDEENGSAKFHIKEVQMVEAEVKVIKCLVDGIVVDISFNQMGGLGALCFLEEMDHLINQDHLFKRSIILIKAWCYYESRLLGAHHGLISTYALEIVILYIFHVFENSFIGPFEVLYRFLELFSNFDWKNYCVSIWGPAPVHLLPDIAVMPPRTDKDEVCDEKIVLTSCSLFYVGLTGAQHNRRRSFVPKYFNIVDPLCIHNNLGRSVSKGNFFRISSAFVIGAKKLSRLLCFPKEEMISELSQFFMNTCERIGVSLHTNFSQPLKSISHLKEDNDIISEDRCDEHLTDAGLFFYGASSHIYRLINQHSKNMCRYTGIQMEDHSSIIRKNPAEKSLQPKKNLEMIDSNYITNFEGEDCRLFSSEACFQSSHQAKKSEIFSVEGDPIIKKSDFHDALQICLEHDCRGGNLNSQTLNSQTVTFIDDFSPLMEDSSLQAPALSSTSHSCQIECVISAISTSFSGELLTDYEDHAQEVYRAETKGDSYDEPKNKNVRITDNGYSIDPRQSPTGDSVASSSKIYPTGPPVPFLAMLQRESYPSDGFYDAFHNEAICIESSNLIGNMGSSEIFDHQEIYVVTSMMGNKCPQASKPGLFYEWSSQNIPFYEPPAYLYPIVVPMVYVQRGFPPFYLMDLEPESQFVPAAHIWPNLR